MGSALNDMKPMYNAIVRAILGDLVHLEMELTRSDGSDVTVDFSLVPVKNDEGQPILIIAEGRDITERKKNEEEAKQHLRESAHFLRLNAMGEMASGMAHELNQPLTAIGSYCESATSMIAELPAANGELKDILMRATEQAHRAGGIIRHLRGFVGKEDSVKEPVDIDVLIYKLVKFVSWQIQKSGIDIEIITGGHGHNVLANKIQIEQVVLNLLMNSMEAIEDAETDKAKLVLQTRIKHDDVVELTVTDNGPGIDASILDLAFDPFQTSKTKGMGLGLSICRSIIETHGGKLWIDEKYQDGARLGFELPVYETAHEYET
jgi:C4-dicarboxylate-specific signal transduction histidine kinase